MRVFGALIRREYLEHRGAFLYAPLLVVAVLVLALASALALNKVRLPFDVPGETALRFFEVGFLGMGGLWFFYLLVALFFYYADAFSADRRNNAMLFWKSMPVSDFTVLSAKMLAGLTLLPALIFLALLISAAMLYGLTAMATLALPRLVLPGPLEALAAFLQLGAFAILYLILALLWYAPFFAWVGALSTVFRRWSIPLAFLIPGLVGLVENLFIADTGPRIGYFLDFLRQRARFGPEREDLQALLVTGEAADILRLSSALLASVDWAQLAEGLIFAALAVYAASEYRRRVIAT